ncbi:MAG: sigma-70 family RNA polymerase sigma factor, partial [Bacteroidetes bacterium]|nr:sigma-70 family RNA polymerase sigma factor [Bacteroidota bacterium]
LPLVYNELRELARVHLRRERPGHTLNPTALVHEAFVRLAGNDTIDWQNRAHFFAIASRAMRRILVDHARSRNAQKRGGSAQAVTFDEQLVPGTSVSADDVLDLDNALKSLETVSPRLAQIVEHRFFGGLSIEETAQVLGISEMTVKRDWRKARAFLAREILATK